MSALGSLQRPRAPRRVDWAALLVMAVAAVVAVAIGVGAGNSFHSLLRFGVPALLSPVALWLFAGKRNDLKLAAIGIYLGCFDGVIKLGTGTSVATLGRDIVLYSAVLGAVAEMIISRRPLRLPPFAGFVLAWFAVVIIQIANPGGVSVVHSLASLRPDLEFVPLFFLGFSCVRTPEQLRWLMIIFAGMAALNGVASLIQANLSPGQLASWGPGYRAYINGTSFGSQAIGGATAFSTGHGHAAVRPFALGGIFGFGGPVGIFGLTAVAALLSIPGGLKRLPYIAPALILAAAAVFTSQARSAVLGCVIALLGFGILTVTTRRGLRVLVVIAVAGTVAYAVFTSVINPNANRFSSTGCQAGCSIALGQLGGTISTTLTVHSTFGTVGKYLVEYPLGAGLGRTGAAGGSSIGGSAGASLNGESEFTYLLVETGIPGLVLMMAFFLTLLKTAWTLRRIGDPSIQRPLMALSGVLVYLTISWPFGEVTNSSPPSPFLWLTAGVMSYWILQVRSGRVSARRQLQAQLRH